MMSQRATEERWERRVQEVGTRAEEEVRRLIQYMNDEVVPDVRRSGSAALRAVALELHRLAERLEATPRGDETAREETQK